MLAIVETCGKQYQLQEGRYVDLEYLGVEANSKVEFDKVLKEAEKIRKTAEAEREELTDILQKQKTS